MATSYTSLLGLALPVTGEVAGTWGDTVNNSITALLDTAVAGTTTLSTDADVTLTTTTGATNQARQAILLCSGARTAVRNITAPAQSKMYVVINNTTGGYGVVIRGVGPTTGVTVASGKTAVVVWNGSDFVEVAPATATTATNLAGGAAGSLPYQSGAGATTFLSIGTNNFVLTSNGTAPIWTTNTGTGNVVRATSPTLVTPVLGTPTSGTLTNCTGLPVSTGVSGLGANVATFLATPSSANLAAAVTDETGSGALVFGTSPTLVTPTFTTSATFPLHIGGTGTTSTLTLRSTSGVGTTGADIIFQTGNNGATEAMRIVNGGNVGIGTASPVFAGAATGLQINGTGAELHLTSTASGAASTDGLSIQMWSDSVAYFIQRENAAMAFWTNNTEKMRLDENGRLGVGTTSPDFELEVETLDATAYASSGAAVTPVTATSAAINVRNAANSNGTAAYLQLNPNNTSGQNSYAYIGAVSVSGSPAPNIVIGMRTGTTAYAERMRIDNAGNVGIGTISPGVRLHVENAAGAYNATADNGIALYLKSTTAAATGNFQGLQFAATSGDSLNSTFTLGITSPATGYSPSMVFSQRTGVSTYAERMRIDGSGNILFGTTATRTLDGANPRVFNEGTTDDTSTLGLVGNKNGSGGPYLMFGKSRGTTLGSNTIVQNGDYLGAIEFCGADGTDINTIGAYIRAEVDGTPGVNDMPGRLTFATTADGAAVSTERVRIDSSGNVGIGTSNPAMTLDVRGASTTSGASRRLVYVSDTTTGFAAGVGGGIALAGIITGSGTVATFGGIQAQKESSTEGVQSGYLTLVTNNGSTLVERMRIDSSGNVGIGTTSPARMFHVASTNPTAFFDRDAGNPGSLALRSSRGTLAAPTQTLANDQLGAISGLGYTSSSAYSAAGVAAIFFNAAEAFTSTAQGAYTTFFTTATGSTTTLERMRIDSSGNVGIGNSAPVNKLDVVGSFGRGAPVTKTGNFTLAATENWVICNGTGTITVTLPAASSWTGREVMIKTIAAQTVVSASSNVVPLAGGAAGTAILAATAGRWATLVSDGTNWVIMSAA